MKAIKYLVMGALMIGFGTPVMAQDGFTRPSLMS